MPLMVRVKTFPYCKGRLALQDGDRHMGTSDVVPGTEPVAVSVLVEAAEIVAVPTAGLSEAMLRLSPVTGAPSVSTAS